MQLRLYTRWIWRRSPTAFFTKKSTWEYLCRYPTGKPTYQLSIAECNWMIIWSDKTFWTFHTSILVTHVRDSSTSLDSLIISLTACWFLRWSIPSRPALRFIGRCKRYSRENLLQNLQNLQTLNVWTYRRAFTRLYFFKLRDKTEETAYLVETRSVLTVCSIWPSWMRCVSNTV